MATRDELVQELNAINGRLSAAAERVATGTRSVQYNLAEARRRRDEIRAEIAQLDAQAPDAAVPVRQVRMFGTRGY